MGAALLVAALLGLAGCATPVENKMLAGATTSSTPYRLRALDDGTTSPELLFVLAMSGGGKRSAAFSYGALTALREITVEINGTRRPLIDEIDAISAVSGGSFTAAAYGLQRNNLFDGGYLNQFLRADLNAEIWKIYLEPWKWRWMFDGDWGTNDEMAKVYDRLLFKGATFADLASKPRPLIAIQATDFSYQTPFTFTQDNFDLLCSDLSSYPLAQAVAASNGFPIIFSPIRLTNYRGTPNAKCDNPAWLDIYLRQDEYSLLRNYGEGAKRYVEPPGTPSYVHLLDGGIGDNLALRGLIQMITPVIEDPAASDEKLKKVRYVISLSIDGQAQSDGRLATERNAGGLRDVIDAVTSTQIDSYGFETRVRAREMTLRVSEAIARIGCPGDPADPKRPRCREVEGQFAHIAFDDLAATDEAKDLKKIPTGLTLKPDDVERVIRAGHDAVLCDLDLRLVLLSMNASLPEVGADRCMQRLVSNDLFLK